MYKLKADLFYYSHKILKVVNMNDFMFKSSNPIDHIIDNIYLGDFRAADDIETLKKLGITHVINCAKHSFLSVSISSAALKSPK